MQASRRQSRGNARGRNVSADRQSGGASSPQPVSSLEIGDAFDWLSGRHILLAVSGGPDSMAMMHLAASVAPSLQLRLAVATVDHGLRETSASEARFVADTAHDLGLARDILEWPGEKPSLRIQERARNERYRLLCEHAQRIGADCIATAHTLDDQAETILFRMARGSGIDGLAGMRRSVVKDCVEHVRPLLGFSKDRLIATCKAGAFRYLEDPSNANMGFARVRFRALLPSLAAEGLTAARFAALAHRAERAEAALNHRVETVLREARLDHDGLALDACRLAREPAEIVVRAMALLALLHRPDAPGEDRYRHARLRRLEALAEDFRHAVDLQGQGRTSIWRRTMAGLVFELDGERRLCILPAPARRAIRKSENSIGAGQRFQPKG